MARKEPEHRLRTAVSQVYRAVTQPNPLRIWAETISDLVDGSMANLTVMGSSGAAAISESIGFKSGANAEFLDHYQHLSPLWKMWRTRPRGEIVRLGEFIDADFKRTEYYWDYWRHLDIGDGLCVAVPTTGVATVVCTACHPRRKDIEETDLHLLSSLYADLCSAFEMAGMFKQARGLSTNLIDGFDRIGVGVAVLSEDGRIEDANTRMRDVIDRGDLLGVRQGRLVPGTSNQLSHLHPLVQRARARGAQGRRLRYRSPSGGGTLMTFSTPGTFEWEGEGQDKVIVLMTEGAWGDGIQAETLRKTHGLTVAEARVARLLVQGKTTRMIATELDVQINSIRAHLKSVYAKTGTHSQVELLYLLQRQSAPTPE